MITEIPELLKPLGGRCQFYSKNTQICERLEELKLRNGFEKELCLSHARIITAAKVGGVRGMDQKPYMELRHMEKKILAERYLNKHPASYLNIGYFIGSHTQTHTYLHGFSN